MYKFSYEKEQVNESQYIVSRPRLGSDPPFGSDREWGVTGCKKENVGFSKEMLSKICQNPCSCFGYRLSYNHPNEVIIIGKEP